MATQDQHDTRFALAIAADWPDLHDDGRDLVFQRLNIYAIIASYGWPTAVASSSAVTADPAYLLLPPVVVPVQQANTQQQGQQRQQDQPRQNRRQQEAAPAPAQAPAPAPAPEQNTR